MRKLECLVEQTLSVAFSHAFNDSASPRARLVNVPCDGVTIDRSGRPGGPLVIAIHGAVANRKTWLPLARALPAEFELWCPDLPGHGSRADVPFTFDGAVASMLELVAAAAPRSVVLAGDSLGGYIALATAARAGGGILGVCAGGCSWTMTGFSGVLARASDPPVRALHAALGSARLERVAHALLERIAGMATASEIVAAGLRIEARSESLQQLAGFDLVTTVRAIRAPIALVNGAWDWPTRAGERSVATAARHAFVRVSWKSGHGVGMLDPAFFARAIAEVCAIGSSG